MPAILISLGTIVRTDNEESFKIFQQLATEAGLKDATGSPLQVRSLLPRLLPLFPKYNQGELSTDQFITALQEILPLSKDQIKEAWNAMCIVDEQALETLATINSFKKSKSEKIYIYSDTNPLHLDKILSEVAGKKPSIGQLTIVTTFQQKLPKPRLLLYVADLIKQDGYEECVLVKGKNGIEDKTLNEQFKVREQQVSESVAAAEKSKQLKITVHEIDGTRLSASVLAAIQESYKAEPAPKKDSSVQVEIPTEGQHSLTYGYDTYASQQKPLQQPQKQEQAGEKELPEQQQEGAPKKKPASKAKPFFEAS